MTDTAKTPILDLLLPSVPRHDFMERFVRRDRHVVVHGDVERLQQIPSCALVSDLPAMVRAYRSLVMVYGADVVDETEGVANRMLVAPEEAVRRYARGCTMEFDCADMFLPGMRPWIAALQRELELPEGSFAKSIVYASPHGGGLGAHFDAYDNFIIQLRGHKNWYLLPNHNAVSPTIHYDLDEQPFVPEELRPYWRGDAPARFLAEAECVELRPGSVLFLPRGYWHATSAADEVLSVNVTFSVPTWLDLLIATVRSRLVADPRWRASADGCGSLDAERQRDVRQQLAVLLDELPDALRLDRDEVVARHRDPHDVYQLAIALFRQGMRV
jgi:50S ribosomal protein L16 3-hydroxylase